MVALSVARHRTAINRTDLSRPIHLALDADDVARIKCIADDYGLRIRGLASPVYKCTLGNAEEEKQHLDLLCRCIAVAHALDTNLIRLFTFWRHPAAPSER